MSTVAPTLNTLFQLQLFHGQHRGPLPQLRLPRDPLLLHGLLRHQPPRWDSALYIAELRMNLQKDNQMRKVVIICFLSVSFGLEYAGHEDMLHVEVT